MATKTSKRQDLEVHLGNGGQVVGRLHLGSGKRSAFSYDEKWLQDARFFRLSPDLQPVLSVQYPRQVFFDALEDTGPDSWGERVIRRAYAKLRQQDRETPALESVDFITWVDDEARVGALQSAQDLHDLLGQGTSLGGARPKSTVRDTDGRLALGKFPSQADQRDVIRGEVLAMQLAAKAGINVATTRVLTEAMTAAAFPTSRGRRCCSPMAAVRPMPIRNW